MSKTCHLAHWMERFLVPTTRSMMGFAVTAILLIGAANQEAEGQTDRTLQLTMGETWSLSYALGVGIATLMKMFLLPEHGIDMNAVRTATDAERASKLISNEAQFALMANPANYLFDSDAQSVMALWREEDEGRPSLQLVVGRSIDDEIVYHVTRILVESGRHLSSMVKQESWLIMTERALQGMSLPLHPGAARYYEELGVPDLPRNGVAISSGDPSGKADIASYLIYFAEDSTKLDAMAASQLSQACEYAATVASGEIRVIPHLAAGADQQGVALARERSVTVVNALKESDLCRRQKDLDIELDSTSPLPEGLGLPALVGRSVEITVSSHD